MRFEVEAVIAGEDNVWLRSRMTAGNTLPFLGWRATGRRVEIDVFDALRFAGTEGIEHRGVVDRLGCSRSSDWPTATCAAWPEAGRTAG